MCTCIYRYRYKHTHTHTHTQVDAALMSGPGEDLFRFLSFCFAQKVRDMAPIKGRYSEPTR